VNPFDADLGINWPLKATTLSSKDASLPTLMDLLKVKKE
jgi:dTDP-4-dehydrorhamnose 3,5-epimerase-like enzyme